MGGGGVSPQPPPMCSKQGRTGHLMANFKSHQKSIYFFNKNEGNKQKVENKVSGRVRVGVGRALLSQYGCIHLIIELKLKFTLTQ